MAIKGKQLATGADGVATTNIVDDAVTSDKVNGTVMSTAAPGAGSDFDAGSRTIKNLAAPSNDNDAATKSYVDSAVVGGVEYQGTWDADANTPTLANGTGTKGFYYKVSTAGSTSLDGITDWQVGDWALFNGTTWDKVDQTETVSSVASKTGAVTLDTDDVSEGSNLYYTEGRVSANSDVAANTGARHSHGNSAVLAATTASFLEADETKLDGIAAGAEVNKTHRQEELTTETITGTDTALTDTLTYAPAADASLMLFFNGVFMRQGAGADYTVSGQTVTWLANTGTAADMTTSDKLTAVYVS